jgi:hypothetical protein
MTDDATTLLQYEAPAIDERTGISMPLAMAVSVCAAFRPAEAPSSLGYERPLIEERTAIDMPLVGGPASGGGSAAFRPTLRD